MIKICDKCGEPTERIIPFPTMDGTGRFEERKVHRMCRCEREQHDLKQKQVKFEDERNRIAELKRLSLMDSTLKSARLSTYKVTQENQKAYKAMTFYLDNFEKMMKSKNEEDERFGLIFHGDVGTGKSYTAAVIANELMEKHVPVIMTSFVKILEQSDKFRSDDEGYMDKLNRAKLLVIDDLGTERSTEYALEKVYNIIDSRCRTGMPIIITTNLPWKQICDDDLDIRYRRIYDRILKMCYPVEFRGMSWRKQAAMERFDKMKKFMEG